MYKRIVTKQDKVRDSASVAGPAARGSRQSLKDKVRNLRISHESK